MVTTALFEAGRLKDLGLLVIDELHMVGDGTSRGAVLEALLVKVKLATRKCNHNLRIIGMSATLAKLEDLARFLNANIVESNFRPVVLKEFVKRSAKLYEVQPVKSPANAILKPVKNFKDTKDKRDPDHLIEVVGERIKQGSCLVFCATKKQCESLAKLLTELLPSTTMEENKFEKRQLLKELKEAENGFLCPVLHKTIPYGIAYHHSGLTGDERELVEANFLKGILTCIVCTSTLAAGVNLPAQRVVIRSPYVGRNFISQSQYKQMCGRAGRAGFGNEYGESILICQQRDEQAVRRLIATPMAGCVSSLAKDTKVVASFILNLLHMGLCRSEDDIVNAMLNDTLYGIQFQKTTDVRKVIFEAISILKSQELIEGSENLPKITDLGRATVRALIPVDKSKMVLENLRECCNTLCVSNLMHFFYIATLLFDEDQIQYQILPDNICTQYYKLSKEELKAAELCGVHPGILADFQRSNRPSLKILRFYITLIVLDTWRDPNKLYDISQR